MEEPVALLSFIDNSEEFIIDSGASKHMVFNKDVLTNYLPTTGLFIRLANGNRIPIVGRGHHGLLRNVLHVPDLKKNLVSVTELTKDGYTITFSGNTVQLSQPHLKDPITIGYLTDKLYVAAFLGDEESDIILQ